MLHISLSILTHIIFCKEKSAKSKLFTLSQMIRVNYTSLEFIRGYSYKYFVIRIYASMHSTFFMLVFYRSSVFITYLFVDFYFCLSTHTFFVALSFYSASSICQKITHYFPYRFLHLVDRLLIEKQFVAYAILDSK